MAFATANDVAALWARELSDEEVKLVERRLEQVERMIRRRVVDLDSQIASGAIAEDDVVDVEADAVLRTVRNPEGYFSEQDGPYMYQRSRETADNSLLLTSQEWASLGVRVGKMFSIAPSIARI